MTEIEDETLSLELNNEDIEELETEETINKWQSKKEKKRVFVLNSIYEITKELDTFNESKKFLILLDNAKHAKELLAILSNQKPNLKRATFGIGNTSIAFNIKHIRGQNPDFIFIHSDIDFNFLNDAGVFFKFSKKESEEISNALIKKDANRELCRKCKEENDDLNFLPYGKETGLVEWKPQFNKDNEPILDENENQLYLEFPELTCEKGHRWYKSEGARRNVKGKNPVLLDSHYKMRQQREIHVKDGTPDPAFTRDRFDKPIQGLYIRVHTSGRKVNTDAQRKAGSSFFR